MCLRTELAIRSSSKVDDRDDEVANSRGELRSPRSWLAFTALVARDLCRKEPQKSFSQKSVSISLIDEIFTVQSLLLLDKFLSEATVRRPANCDLTCLKVSSPTKVISAASRSSFGVFFTGQSSRRNQQDHTRP